jgi:hypothetical protein
MCVRWAQRKLNLISELIHMATLGQRRERYGRITFRWILESSFVTAEDEF